MRRPHGPRAGDAREILLAIGTDDLAALDDRRGSAPTSRSVAASTRPGSTYFSEAARTVTGFHEPIDFLDARLELDGPGADDGERTIERVDPSWITAVARIADSSIDAIAGRWIDLVEEELGDAASRGEALDPRSSRAQVVAFCRTADAAPDVLFAWSL